MHNDQTATRRALIVLGFLSFAMIAAAGFYIFNRLPGSESRSGKVLAFLRDPAAHQAWSIAAGKTCGDAPFQMPSGGMIGYLWEDSFRIGHRHQGIDIFGGTGDNQTPVYAAYSGYLTRQEDWISSLIVRIAEDPLSSGRQIWMYYTHMASPSGESYISADFPPGSHEVYVEAGTLLGYQGSYSGTAGSPVGVHLHFSIVRDDGEGGYLNELEIGNTLDPSPYLGLALNGPQNPDEVPVCPGEE